MKTFIVRIWREPTDLSDELRGTVHDIELGERRTFQTQEELVALLDHHPDTNTSEPAER